MRRVIDLTFFNYWVWFLAAGSHRPPVFLFLCVLCQS